jgi:hypothetical protein
MAAEHFSGKAESALSQENALRSNFARIPVAKSVSISVKYALLCGPLR